MATTKPDTTKTPLLDIWKYATGEGANSLVINAIFTFSMVYFTDALGLEHKLAGIAMGIAIFWDAITDPIMAYITDHTRSRFGRRHPYILIGGVMTVVCSFFIWCVPDFFRTSNTMLFWYLVGVNLLLRTSITIFAIPYGALGFEICTDYDDRGKLQGIKSGFNMALNLIGPGITGWAYFLRDPDKFTKGTSIPENYLRMGAVYAITGLVFILLVVFLTRKYIVDTRNEKKAEKFSAKVFYNYFKDVVADCYARLIFAFMFITFIGTMLVCTLQIFVYIHFMNFTSGQKAFANSASMVGCGLGALCVSFILRRFDKKKAVYAAVALSIFSNIALLVIFVGRLMPVDFTYSLGNIEIPVALIVFTLFHAAFWFGNGVVSPIAWSMLADLSEIGKYKTGELKDGGYGAALTFTLKTGSSIAIVLSGYMLTWAGLVPGADVQTAEASRNAAAMTFIGGSIIYILAVLIISRYKITRELVHRIKDAIAARERGEDYEKIDI